MRYVYELRDVTRRWGAGKPVLDGISLSFMEGAKIGIVGENGSGKSALLRIMAGMDKEHGGDARASEGVAIGYAPQEPELDEGKSVKETVLEGVGESWEALRRYEELSARFGEEMGAEEMEALVEEQAALQERVEELGAWDLEWKVEMAMAALGCPSGEARVGDLSGGERRRAALCRELLRSPDLVLLDEPTNHLDAATAGWLEGWLKDFGGTVVMVTHDRYMLDGVADWILELDGGKGYPHKGNYGSWLEERARRRAGEATAEEGKRRMLERELEWVRSTPAAKRKKSRARLKRFEERKGEGVLGERGGGGQMELPRAERLSGDAVWAEGLTKKKGGKTLMEGLSFRLPPGGVMGVVGGNGAGKTTLLRILMGLEEADEGETGMASTARALYVDQARENLSLEKRVWEEIGDGEEVLDFGGGRKVNARAWASAFGFRGERQQRRVKDLSGGERNRAYMAKMLRGGGNVLLLDEPANDLDVGTLRALEEALEAFEGSAVIVSHDRWFLDRLATHMLGFEGEGSVKWFEGTYAEYDEDRRERLGDDPEGLRRARKRRFARLCMD